MKTGDCFEHMFGGKYTRVIQMVYSHQTGQTTSDIIEKCGDYYILIVNGSEIGAFESEEGAFFYWKTEFDCKVAEPIMEKKNHWWNFWRK